LSADSTDTPHSCFDSGPTLTSQRHNFQAALRLLPSNSAASSRVRLLVTLRVFGSPAAAFAAAAAAAVSAASTTIIHLFRELAEPIDVTIFRQLCQTPPLFRGPRSAPPLYRMRCPFLAGGPVSVSLRFSLFGVSSFLRRGRDGRRADFVFFCWRLPRCLLSSVFTSRTHGGLSLIGVKYPDRGPLQLSNNFPAGLS
jgi:hypothetical protein